MWETFGCMSMHTEIVLPVIADWTGCLETSRSYCLFMECNILEEQDTSVHNTYYPFMECNILEEHGTSVRNTFELNYPINSNVWVLWAISG